MSYFYNKTIFNNTVSLSKIFNNLVVYRVTSAGEQTGDPIEVSVVFGPVDPIYAQNKADLTKDNKKYYQPVVKIGLLLKEFYFAKDRAIGSYEDISLWNPTSAFSDMSGFYKEINPTPFDFEYELQIRSTKFEYAAQVVEQIAPYFIPDQNIRVKELAYLNLERDLKVEIEQFPFEFKSEIDFDERRYIAINIPITLKGFLYRPIGIEKIIKYIHSDYRILPGIYNGEATANGPQIFVEERPDGIYTSPTGEPNTWRILNSEVSYSTDQFMTSGFETGDIFPQPSQYNTSGINNNGIYYFTSAFSEN